MLDSGYWIAAQLLKNFCFLMPHPASSIQYQASSIKHPVSSIPVFRNLQTSIKNFFQNQLYEIFKNIKNTSQ